MNFTKENVSNAIVIEFNAVMYGQDQAYVDHPVTFPTVNFYLSGTGTLDKIADEKRMALGLLPMWARDGAEDYDGDGWYDFYIGINGFSKTKLDSSIMFVVASDMQEDDGKDYYIDLTEEEQRIIYAELDKQCKESLEKSCEELLEEAREEMEECME